MGASMTCRFVIRASVLWFCVLSVCIVPRVLAQNLTVGDDVGDDHTAYVFAPFRWEADRGEHEYRDHVGSANEACGQQYAYFAVIESADPNPNPNVCTVNKFKEIIRDKETSLGTLLITTHGRQNGISVEAYAHTAPGRRARDDAFRVYLGHYPADQIYRGSTRKAYTIGVKSSFIRAHGRLSQGLVYVASCEGGTLVDDFEAADARVAVGNSDCPVPSRQKTRVTTFFRRMDGKEGLSMRRVEQALLALSLTRDGAPNTTLAPAVWRYLAPPELENGTVVQFIFDTTCETNLVPDILFVGENISAVEDEEWADNITLKGTVRMREGRKIRTYQIKLPHDLLFSDQNAARLDGNMNPAPLPVKNAEGPAHDDYRRIFADHPGGPGFQHQGSGSYSSLGETTAFAYPVFLSCNPNPFAGATRITYELTSPAQVKLRVFDVNGRLVRTLVDDIQAGRYVATWDGTNTAGERVAPGTYFCRLSAAGEETTQKVILRP